MIILNQLASANHFMFLYNIFTFYYLSDSADSCHLFLFPIFIKEEPIFPIAGTETWNLCLDKSFPVMLSWWSGDTPWNGGITRIQKRRKELISNALLFDTKWINLRFDNRFNIILNLFWIQSSVVKLYKLIFAYFHQFALTSIARYTKQNRFLIKIKQIKKEMLLSLIEKKSNANTLEMF